MKTYRSFLPIAAAVLLGSAASLVAGPGPQYWATPRAAAPAKEVKKVTPDSNAPGCPACKTETIREFTSGMPNGKGTPRWTDVGTKHTCDHCNGAITVVKGKTTNTMPANCPMGGKDAAVCCAGVKVPAKNG